MKLIEYDKWVIKCCYIEEDNRMVWIMFCEECKYRWVQDCTTKRLYDILNNNENYDDERTSD